jgi:hypothetical protein
VSEDTYLKRKQAEIKKGIRRSLSAMRGYWRRNIYLYIVRHLALNFFILTSGTATSPSLFIGHLRWWFR